MCKCLTDCPFNLHLFDSLTQLHNVKLKIIILWFFHIRSIVVSMISCYKVTNWDVSVLPSHRQTRVLLDKVAPRMTSLKLATGKLHYLFTSILQFLHFKSHFLSIAITTRSGRSLIAFCTDEAKCWPNDWDGNIAGLTWTDWDNFLWRSDWRLPSLIKIEGPQTPSHLTPPSHVSPSPATVTVLVKSLDSEDQPESPLQLQTDSRVVNISGQSGIGFDYVIAELYCWESYLHIISNFAVI